MLKILDISIRGKLVIMQVFTSLLVLSIFITVFIFTDIRDYKQRKINSLVSLAQVIGSNNISTLDFRSDDVAKEGLAELRKVSPDIVQAGILEKDGHLFAGYIKPGTDSTKVSVPDINSSRIEFAGKHLIVKSEINDNGQIKGYVFLEADLAELEAIKQSKYRIASILLFISIGVSFLIGVAIQPYISKRILSLANRMKEVSKTGDYSVPVSDRGKDEISVLFKVFNEMMQQIRGNEKKKDEFIGIASHELKTPLTSIKGYLELLNGVEDRQPNKQFVQKARENVDKLEGLIKDLLDVSKIQSGQLELNMKEFSIDELIDETIASFQITVSTHDIIRENGVHKVVLADRQRIEQVLVNLLSNAIKYSPGASKVIVASKKTATDLIVSVRDFGIGIPEEEQVNIFKRFYRTKDMSVHISGFGLGLYICQDIITRHKGKIWVNNEINGSSFFFSLPLENKADIVITA